MISTMFSSGQCTAQLYKHHRQDKLCIPHQLVKAKFDLDENLLPACLKYVSFPWSSLAANLIANADWLTTVIPWRQLTVDKTQSPFVAQVTRQWDYGGIPTEHGYAMDSEWTPGAAPPPPKYPSLLIMLKNLLCTHHSMTDRSSNASFSLFSFPLDNSYLLNERVIVKKNQ